MVSGIYHALEPDYRTDPCHFFHPPSLECQKVVYCETNFVLFYAMNASGTLLFVCRDGGRRFFNLFDGL